MGEVTSRQRALKLLKMLRKQLAEQEKSLAHLRLIESLLHRFAATGSEDARKRLGSPTSGCFEGERLSHCIALANLLTADGLNRKGTNRVSVRLTMKKGTKRPTATQMEEKLAKVAHLDRRGYSQPEIAAKLGVSVGAVNGYLKRVRQRYAESRQSDREAMVMQKLQEHREVIKEAWEAWERSKDDAKKVVTEQVPGKQSKAQKKAGTASKPQTKSATTTVEARLPDDRYLNTVLKALKQIAELFGLEAPKKMQVEAQVVPWDVLAAASARAGGPDVVEEIIEMARSGREPPKLIQTVEVPNPAEADEIVRLKRYVEEQTTKHGLNGDGR